MACLISLAEITPRRSASSRSGDHGGLTLKFANRAMYLAVTLLFTRSRPRGRLGSGKGRGLDAAMCRRAGMPRRWGCLTPAGLIRDLNESRFRFRAGVSRIVLRDRRHRLPNVVYQPKNLAVIAKRVKIAGISGDLNNGPGHSISPGPKCPIYRFDPHRECSAPPLTRPVGHAQFTKAVGATPQSLHQQACRTRRPSRPQ